MEARNSNGTRRTPTHKVRSITTQDVLWRVKPRGSLAAALKSYLLYRPCARARAFALAGSFLLPPYSPADYRRELLRRFFQRAGPRGRAHAR